MLKKNKMVKVIIKKFIPSFLLSWYHFLLAFLGALFYKFPSKGIKVIGVTGTKGKSTVAELTSKILEEAGFKTALVSTVRFKIGEKEWRNMLKMTMPGRLKIQKFLRKAVNSGCQYAILEVTSEGILQHRHRFIDFDVAVFTNLSPEHIERHGSFENYKAAKGKLFKTCRKIHIVNLDETDAEYFLDFEAQEKYKYSMEKIITPNRQLPVTNCLSNEKGISFKIQNTQFNLALLGKFNVYNALAAICVGLSQGIALEVCKRGLERCKLVPGRMEIVITEPFRVIVDYAHTPDSLEKVYKTVSELKISARSYPSGRQAAGEQQANSRQAKLICVFGSCGGGRDKWKRPELGKIAAKYCDKIILTNEDPYDENPRQILSQIKSGIPNDKFLMTNLYEILDRREAIRRALSLAKDGDVIVVTGKGSEPWMCVENDKKIPWDDRKIVKEEFNKLKNKN